VEEIRMKKFLAFTMALLLLGVAIVGCIGGESPTSSKNSPTTTQTPLETQTQEQTSPTETATETPAPTSPETQTSIEEAYWKPWEYSTVRKNGAEYKIIGYRLSYKVRPSSDSETYEYTIEKNVKRTKIQVFGIGLSGEKVDLGKKNVYEYETTVTPINSVNMEDKLIFRFWLTNESQDMFIYPWDIGWSGIFSPMGGEERFVGVEFEYRGKKFTVINPTPYKKGLFPYINGNSEWMKELNDDLNNLYMGWAAMVNLALWSAWSDKNVLVPQQGTWSDGTHSWEWETRPDGEITFSGVTFRVINAEWKYSGEPEGIKLSGNGKFAPEIFIPLSVEGWFSSKDPKTGENIEIYGAYELQDIKLEEI